MSVNPQMWPWYPGSEGNSELLGCLLFYVTHRDFSLEHAWIRSKGPNPEVMETLVCVLELRGMQMKQKILLDVMGFWGLSLETSGSERNSQASRKNGTKSRGGQMVGRGTLIHSVPGRRRKKGGRPQTGWEGKKEAEEEFSSLALMPLAHFTDPWSPGLLPPLKCSAQRAQRGKRRLAMGSPGLRPVLLLPPALMLLLLLLLLLVQPSRGFPGRS